MTDGEIAAAIPQILPRDVSLSVGSRQAILPSRTVLYGKDLLSIRVIQQNFERRPVVWAVTAAGNYYGLDPLVVQRGLGIDLDTVPVDTALAKYDLTRLMGVPLDVPATARLMDEVYRYGGLLEHPSSNLEPTASGMASTLVFPTSSSGSPQNPGATA